MERDLASRWNLGLVQCQPWPPASSPGTAAQEKLPLSVTLTHRTAVEVSGEGVGRTAEEGALGLDLPPILGSGAETKTCLCRVWSASGPFPTIFTTCSSPPSP